MVKNGIEHNANQNGIAKHCGSGSDVEVGSVMYERNALAVVPKASLIEMSDEASHVEPGKPSAGT
jgi:hypothetical protein